MADCEELVTSDCTWSPDFIQELLPSAARMALLYHLSYLRLGHFPKLKSLIREQTLETQLLFGYSETFLLKCVSTSHNLVCSEFPMLKWAIEVNEPFLAMKYMEKARAWIIDTISDMVELVNRYEQQNRSLAFCTSNVFQEQKKTEKRQTPNSEEMKSLKATVAKLEEKLRKIAKNIEEKRTKIEEKKSELQNHIKSVSRKSHDMDILAALVPFARPFIKSIYDTTTAPEATQIQALKAELSRLTSEKSLLQNKEWTVQVKLIDHQLQLANSRIQPGVIPSPVHLKDVQQCFSRIQQILIQLQKFWEKVETLLGTLKDKTFAGEDLFEDLDDMKEEFLKSVEIAGEYWQTFGGSCRSAQGVLRVQSKDAYKFLEINPSSLSEDERKEQYESVMEKLKQISIRPQPPSLSDTEL